MKEKLYLILCLWIGINAVLTGVSFFKERGLSSHNDNKANLKIALINAFFEAAAHFLGLSLLAFILKNFEGHFSGPLEWGIFNFLICLIVVDFFYFLSHLAHHKVQFLWNMHVVHHSANTFSLTTGYRKSWFYFLTKWFFFVPFVLFPFPAEMVLFSLVLIVNFTHLLHLRSFPRIYLVEKIINTPAAHRIHHSSLEAHIDKNMGGLFLVWDQLFGTFSLEKREKVIYGLTKPLKTENIWKINTEDWTKAVAAFRKYKFSKKFWTYLFNSPTGNKNFSEI